MALDTTTLRAIELRARELAQDMTRAVDVAPGSEDFLALYVAAQALVAGLGSLIPEEQLQELEGAGDRVAGEILAPFGLSLAGFQ